MRRRNEDGAMGNLWAKIKFWTKGTVFCVLFLYVAFFIFSNYSNKTKVSLVFKDEEFSTLFLIVFSFLAGVIATVLFRATRNALRQMRELRERALKEKFEKEHEEKEIALKERLEREHREKELSLKQQFEREHQEKTQRAAASEKPAPSAAAAVEPAVAAPGDETNEA